MTMTRKLLAGASAVAMITGFAGAASAQVAQSGVSVLERVLGAVDGTVANAGLAPGTGASVFANIASTNVDVVLTGLAGATSTIVGNIDGSITIDLANIGADPGVRLTNVYEEIDNTVGANTALRTEIDAITFDIGEVATTVLGAVNTGDIDLAGTVNSISETYSETVSNATAGLSSAMSDVNSNLFEVDTGMLGDASNPILALNLADNMASITGAILITADSVNGAATGIATTVLGAVNTGNISQSAATNAAGVVTSITGR